MAAVTFNTVILNLADDVTQTLTLLYVSGVSGGPTNSGEDRQYGTRVRGVATGVTTQTRTITADELEPSEVATLFAFAGQTLCFRDPTGTKFYGTFRSPAVTWNAYSNTAGVSFTVTEQTFSEAA
jgi:hypothetical protein